jgi:hypothetical protein
MGAEGDTIKEVQHEERRLYFSFAYSALAAMRTGISGSVSFPQREENLIGRLGLGGVALHGIGSADLEMRECADERVLDNFPVIHDFLKLGSSLIGLVCSESSLPSLSQRIINPHLIRSSGSQNLDGIRRVVTVQS